MTPIRARAANVLTNFMFFGDCYVVKKLGKVMKGKQVLP